MLLDKNILLPLAVLFLFSIAYFLPFVKFRQYTWLKLLVLAGVWIGATFLIPLYLSTNFEWQKVFQSHCFLYLFLSKFLFLVGLCVAFDIRDITIDNMEGTRTLAALLGTKYIKLIALLCMCSSEAFVYLSHIACELMYEHFIVHTISIAITSLLLFFLKPTNKEFYYSIGLDGMIILQGVLCFFV